MLCVARSVSRAAFSCQARRLRRLLALNVLPDDFLVSEAGTFLGITPLRYQTSWNSAEKYAALEKVAYPPCFCYIFRTRA